MLPEIWRKKLDALTYTGQRLQWLLKKGKLSYLYADAQKHNVFFTPANVAFSLNHIAHHYLDRKKLESWLKKYADRLAASTPAREVGMVLAGNIPLVGFHDILVGYLSPHRVQVKLSHDDPVLIPWLMELLAQFDEEAPDRIRFVERLREYEAVIATGSDTSAHYFSYYFRDVPHVIRRTRHSMAVLAADVSDEELRRLGEDVFVYFGLGCRNVNLLWVPRDFALERLATLWEPAWHHLMTHAKYANNYLYWKSIFAVEDVPHEDFGFVLLHEAPTFTSGMGVVHYARYDDIEQVKSFFRRNKKHLQCVVCAGTHSICYDRAIQITRPGKAQRPSLRSYADGIDTMDFLLGLQAVPAA